MLSARFSKICPQNVERGGREFKSEAESSNKKKEIIKKYRKSVSLLIGIETVDADDYMKI